MAQLVKNLPAMLPGFDPWVGKIPWRRERLPTPVFWPGEFHGEVHGVAKSWTRLSDISLHTSRLLDQLIHSKLQVVSSPSWIILYYFTCQKYVHLNYSESTILWHPKSSNRAGEETISIMMSLASEMSDSWGYASKMWVMGFGNLSWEWSL